MAPRYGTATVTTPAEVEVAITRTFEAPAALVWETFTTPRYVMRWWGPSFSPLVECAIDLRVGGAWRYVMRHDDGREIEFGGTYLEIDPPVQIVSTESMVGVPGEVVNTMTLEERDGVTTVTIVARTGSREERDALIASGMESGVQDHYDQLDDVLAARDLPAEQFRRFAGTLADRIRAVPPDAWERPSPCAGWTARDVVGHMVEWMPAFLASIGEPLPVGPDVAGDPAAAWDHVAAEIQAVLDDPDRAAREFEHAHLGTDTVERAISKIMVGDVFVHAWDLARATGGDQHLAADRVHEMLTGMPDLDELLRTSGQYGPKVPVADDADEQSRLLAFLGRTP